MSDLIEEHGTIFTIDAKEYDPLMISGKVGTTIFRIDNHGKIFWNGREVESDEEFRKTMINLTNYLSTLVFKG
jgi:hypothetical protein